MPPKKTDSLWLASNPSKRWTEVFFLAYSPFWIAYLLCVIVPFGIYEHLGKAGYLAVGVAMAAPCVLLPLLLPRPADRGKPWHEQYWVIANVWIAVLSFVGNYLWTHYFYELLGAAYTFPSWRLNNVPIGLYLMTHAYFCFYHALANVVIRRVKHASSGAGPILQTAAMGVAVFLLSYATAFMETLTIAHFPYYTHKDKAAMYSVGSLFYAIYFFVSFPMFFRIGEASAKQRSGEGGGATPKWNVGRAILDSLAACMAVTLLLDFWRLAIGDIIGEQSAGSGAEIGGGAVGDLPWL